jgi:hypothetical protein
MTETEQAANPAGRLPNVFFLMRLMLMTTGSKPVESFCD